MAKKDIGNDAGYQLVQGNWQYRNREDITILPGNVLVVGSQNVVTNTSGRIQIVKGYTLDGAVGTISAPILSSFDFQMVTGETRHLRAYTDPTSGKGVLQVRHKIAGVVTWDTLKDDLNLGLLNFTEFYDFNANFLNLLLFVDGSSNIYEWSGAETTYASRTANTITKEGTTSWAEEGFYTVTAGRKITLSGVDYTYTGGEGTTTLTGVTPDPTATPHTVGELISQKIITTTNASCTDLPSDFTNSLIATLNNQIYIGAADFQDIYISVVNDYTDFHFSNPRTVGEGMVYNLDGIPTALIPQENKMYISAGKDQWYCTQFTLSSDLANESLQVERLKTASLQAAQSQAFVTKDKNNVVFVSNEPVLTTLGRVADNLATPQMGDISYPVINDFNAYDFTDGCAFYYKNFLLVAIPKKGLIRVYNQTDPSRQFWEAPITYAVSRFSIIDGELYGHSYLTPETYKLFDGYNFNGQPIPALAAFAFQNYGTRYNSKGLHKVYIEGYISQNVTPNDGFGGLKLGIRRDIDGCATDTEKSIDGNSKQIVCIGGSDAPLGKEAIGKNPFGGDNSEQTNLPPKFRVIKTLPIAPYFYEVQFSFYSAGIDYQWEIVAFGPKLVSATDTSASITQ